MSTSAKPYVGYPEFENEENSVLQEMLATAAENMLLQNVLQMPTQERHKEYLAIPIWTGKETDSGNRNQN